MKPYLNSIFFSIAIIIAALVIGNSYANRSKVDGTITVTGLGKKDFTSDLIVWNGSYSKVNSDLKAASAGLENDKKIIEEYLNKNGINTKDIVFSAVDIREKFKSKYSDDGKFNGDEFEGYTLTQSVQIKSKEVEKIENISRKITDLINEGIQFYSEPPGYYFTKLADLKIELISNATEDARARAEKISEKSGGDIGDLISAQMGIFQITGLYSNEEFSSGGTFNTSSKEKSASITMKLTYRVD